VAITHPSPTFPQFPGGAVDVVPNNVVRFSPSVIYVGVTGNVSVVTPEGGTVVFVAVPAGAVIPVQVIGVNTASTATSMVRIY
jgi:hypothetical protein